ncbi:hypothetical protein D3C75_1215320 [compost metagenome]
METDASFVGTNSAVELNAKPPVDLYAAGIVHPWHAEGYAAFRLDQTFKNTMLPVAGMSGQYRNECIQNFFDSLMEFPFMRVPGDHLIINSLYIFSSPC